jgi:CheY-like chemotaxis protein/two-component sensor histidine kinase
MRMWLHLLRKKAPESVAHELAAIERCADAQGRLVTDLLDVSRALRGKLSMEATTVDLAEVVAPVVENMRPDATAKQLTLGADLERGCLVRGDPNRLRQVATNLLSNAIKFTREHGKVSVSVAHDGDRVVLAVEDDGVGIEVEQLAKIFEPFWQASESTTRSYGGLGLGLAIVKQIVELHGGAVRAESLGRDQGARLLVVLESADAAPLPDAVEGPRSSLEGMSVLLVEDDVETRDSVALVLKSFGADVRVAASAADGMRELEASVPDVFLCDVSMPGEDGYSLMRRVRRSEGPQAKVLAVAFTAHARTEDRQRAREAGFNEHLGKPIAPEDLAAAILKLSRGRRST